MSIKYANNNSLSAITTQPSGLSSGAMTLLSTQTASASATIDFTSGIDDTYKEYLFTFNNIHPSVDKPEFQIQFNAAGGSGFNETITSTSFASLQYEDASAAELSYQTAHDLAQATGGQNLFANLSNDNDSSVTGDIMLFNPSSDRKSVV